MTDLSTTDGPALEAVTVTKRFDDVVALEDVSVHASRGSCLALVGESGSGKTTLLRTFNRLVEPDAGTVRVRGLDVAGTDAVELRRSIGYVQQEGGLLPHWTVQRNAALVPRLRGLDDPPERATAALELVGLPPDQFARRWPAQLSGGQRQRVAIARALAASPDVILLDEPFGALDAITRYELQEAFLELKSRLSLTAVLVTHDLTEALRLSDRVAVLRDGRVEQIGAPSDLLDDPATPYVHRLLERAGVRHR